MPHKDPAAKLEYMRNYRERNRERINRLMRERYQRIKNDPEFLKKQRESARRWRKNHPEVRRASYKRHYARHRKEIAAKNLEYQHRIKRLWRNGKDGLTDVKQKRMLGKQAEILALRILPELGFQDILYLGGQQFVDFLAVKNGSKCGVEVSINPYKYLGHSDLQLKLLQFLNLKHYALFITPDLSKYVLKENPRYAYTRIYLRDFENLVEVLPVGAC